jgi:hypothetical protein
MFVEIPDNKIEGEKIELSIGKVAMVNPCLGKHIRQATKMAGTDQSMFMPAVMALLVTIDGNACTMEQFDELPGADYMAILNKVSGGLGDFT